MRVDGAGKSVQHVGVMPATSTRKINFVPLFYLTFMQIRRRRRKIVKKGPKQLRVNQQIRIPEVRLIDETGEMLGIVPTEEALRRAEEAGMDLVEVDPTQNPSIVRIIDWGHVKYEREKKERKAKAKQKKTEVKGIRLSFRIKGNDLETRINQARKFLEAGHKVKFETVLKGRERAHKGLAVENLKRIVEEMGDGIETITPLSAQGNTISITISAKASSSSSG